MTVAPQVYKSMSRPLPLMVDHDLQLALFNLKMAVPVCEFLIAEHPHSVPIPSEIYMRGATGLVHLSGTHCGFLTTSIVHCAVLDIRRLLAFLRLICLKETNLLSNLDKKRWASDFDVTDIDVLPPTPSQMRDLSMKLTGKNPDGFLFAVVRYVDKGLAHFSVENRRPDLPDLLDAAKLMEEAVNVFVYDAIGMPRPTSGRVTHE